MPPPSPPRPQSKLNFDELQTVHDEVEIMHKIHHEHAVQLIEMYESKKKIWMVMEILTGGELFDRIVSKGCYSEKEASEVVKGVASALEYLHGVGITHRDLKPENLLYKSPDPGSPIKLTSAQHRHSLGSSRGRREDGEGSQPLTDQLRCCLRCDCAGTSAWRSIGVRRSRTVG